MARRSSGSQAGSREEDYYDSNQDGADNDPSPGLLGNGSRDEDRRMEGNAMAVSAVAMDLETSEAGEDRWEEDRLTKSRRKAKRRTGKRRRRAGRFWRTPCGCTCGKSAGAPC